MIALHVCPQLFAFASMIGICLMFASADRVLAQEFDEKLNGAIEKFEDRKASARDRCLKEFDKLKNQVRGNRNINEAARADFMARCDQYKYTFMNSGQLPAIDETFQLEARYFGSLQKAFSPIDKLIETELKRANGAGDSEYALDLVRRKQQLYTSMMGAAPIAAGQVFAGTLTRPKGATILFELHIKDVGPSGAFTGRVEDNAGVGGNWKYRVSGERNGTSIKFRMTESLRGEFVAVEAQGVLAGERLVGDLVSRGTKGKPVKNTISLRRR